MFAIPLMKEGDPPKYLVVSQINPAKGGSSSKSVSLMLGTTRSSTTAQLDTRPSSNLQVTNGNSATDKRPSSQGQWSIIDSTNPNPKEDISTPSQPIGRHINIKPRPSSQAQSANTSANDDIITLNKWSTVSSQNPNSVRARNSSELSILGTVQSSPSSLLCSKSAQSVNKNESSSHSQSVTFAARSIQPSVNKSESRDLAQHAQSVTIDTGSKSHQIVLTDHSVKQATPQESADNTQCTTADDKYEVLSEANKMFLANLSVTDPTCPVERKHVPYKDLLSVSDPDAYTKLSMYCHCCGRNCTGKGLKLYGLAAGRKNLIGLIKKYGGVDVDPDKNERMICRRCDTQLVRFEQITKQFYSTCQQSSKTRIHIRKQHELRHELQEKLKKESEENREYNKSLYKKKSLSLLRDNNMLQTIINSSSTPMTQVDLAGKTVEELQKYQNIDNLYMRDDADCQKQDFKLADLLKNNYIDMSDSMDLVGNKILIPSATGDKRSVITIQCKTGERNIPKKNSGPVLIAPKTTPGESLSTLNKNSQFSVTGSDHDYIKLEPEEPWNDILSKTLCGRKSEQIKHTISLMERKRICTALKSAYVEPLAEEIMKNKKLRDAVEMKIMEELSNTCSNVMSKRKNGFCSQLFSNEENELDWKDVVLEIAEKMPTLLNVMLAVSISHTDVTGTQLEKLMPRLGMVYSILMQARLPGLSKVQRLMSLFLKQNVTHRRLFARMQSVGFSLSYGHVIRLKKEKTTNLQRAKKDIETSINPLIQEGDGQDPVEDTPESELHTPEADEPMVESEDQDDCTSAEINLEEVGVMDTNHSDQTDMECDNENNEVQWSLGGATGSTMPNF